MSVIRQIDGLETAELWTPRLWVPKGLLSPVDVRAVQLLSWEELVQTFDPNAFTGDQWNVLMKLAANHWLEHGMIPAHAGKRGLGQAAILGSGKAQSFQEKAIVSAAVANDPYFVLGYVTQIILKLWGAGGACGTSTTVNKGGDGGPGAFLQTTLNVFPFEELRRYVGGRGTTAPAGPLGNPVYSGPGGGYSGLWRLAGNQRLAVAGGGSGGSGGSGSSGYVRGANGKGGGAQNGSDGESWPNAAVRGRGGTTSAGGVGGSSSEFIAGSAGSALQGGAGGDTNGGSGDGLAGGLNGGGDSGLSATVGRSGGGGGGGGEFGGGGGAGRSGGSSSAPGGAAGAGSSVATGQNISYAASATVAAPNSSDQDYVAGRGAGVTGPAANDNSRPSAGDGLLVMTY